jgi:hypothetical protein
MSEKTIYKRVTSENKFWYILLSFTIILTIIELFNLKNPNVLLIDWIYLGIFIFFSVIAWKRYQWANNRFNSISIVCLILWGVLLLRMLLRGVY